MTVLSLQGGNYRRQNTKKTKFTGWLDGRIAMRVRAERPPWYLSVFGGACPFSIIFWFSTGTLFHYPPLYFLLCPTQKASASSAAVVSDYVGSLEKGQIPPKHVSLVQSQVSLNIEGSKYTV